MPVPCVLLAVRIHIQLQVHSEVAAWTNANVLGFFFRGNKWKIWSWKEASIARMPIVAIRSIARNAFGKPFECGNKKLARFVHDIIIMVFIYSRLFFTNFRMGAANTHSNKEAKKGRGRNKCDGRQRYACVCVFCHTRHCHMKNSFVRTDGWAFFLFRFCSHSLKYYTISNNCFRYANSDSKNSL